MNIEEFMRLDRDVSVKSISIIMRACNSVQTRRWLHKNDEFYRTLGKSIRENCPYAKPCLMRSGFTGLHRAQSRAEEPGQAQAWEDFEALWDERHPATLALNSNMICAPVGSHSAVFRYRDGVHSVSNLKVGATAADLAEDLKAYAEFANECAAEVILWSGSVWDRKAQPMQSFTIGAGMSVSSFPGMTGIVDVVLHSAQRRVYKDEFIETTSDPVNRRYVGSTLKNEVDTFWTEEFRPFIQELRTDPSFATIQAQMNTISA